MPSFPLLTLDWPLLRRFVALCHPYDAVELSKTCDTLKSMIDSYGYKMIENLHICGEEVGNSILNCTLPNTIKISISDPNFDQKIKNLIVVEKLCLIQVSPGLVTKLPNLGLTWTDASIVVLHSNLSQEDLELLTVPSEKLRSFELSENKKLHHQMILIFSKEISLSCSEDTIRYFEKIQKFPRIYSNKLVYL